MGEDETVAAWVASKLPIPFVVSDFGPYTTIGMKNEQGALVAGAVYHRWRSFDCEVTFAATAPRWTMAQNVSPLFHYPFVQHSLKRITLIIGGNNKRALRTNIKLGFRVEGVVRRAYDGVNDAWVLGMLREECRYINR